MPHYDIPHIWLQVWSGANSKLQKDKIRTGNGRWGFEACNLELCICLELGD